MTEKEYIEVQNLTRLRAANEILRSVTDLYFDDGDRTLFNQAMENIIILREKLWQIDITEEE